MIKSQVWLVSLIALASVALGAASSGAALKKAASGHTCTIIGTEKSETLKGTSKADVICGFGGNDVLYGFGGNDILDGGSGNDRLYGGDGNDSLNGGTGVDTIDGGSGSNLAKKDAGDRVSRSQVVVNLPQAKPAATVSAAPSTAPSASPTSSTSATPSPTSSPSGSPTASPTPSASPGSGSSGSSGGGSSSATPTPTPSASPTASPSPSSTPAPSSSPSANVIRVDFEAPSSTLTLVGFNGDSPSLAVAPTPSPLGSTNALRIARDASSGGAGSVFYTAAQTLISQNSLVVTLELYAPAANQAVLLKLENPSNANDAVETLATTTQVGWQTMTFNFANNRSGTPVFSSATSYRKAVIFYGFGTSTGALTAYVDNVTFQPETSATPAPTPSAYTRGALLWSDEFNSAAGALDSGKWTSRYCGHASSNGGGACHNNEQQSYQPSANALDGSGNAVITTEKLSTSITGGQCLAWSGSCPFTSGRFDTQGKVSFQYGLIEARIQNPVGGANWPAFWMLGTDITSVGWPSSGEIDIMEGKSSSLVSGAIHWSNGGNDAYAYANHPGDNFTNGFHVYSIYWLENYIALYVDGVKILERTNTTLDQAGTWAFNHPFFIIFNNAVSPAGGFSDAYNGWSSSQMKIDYVRHYQLNGVGTVGN